MKTFISFLFLFSGLFFSDTENSTPETRLITETPAKDYTRTYSVLVDNPAILYGAFTEVYRGVEITTGYYKDNYPEGNWIFYSLNGRVERKMTFKEGKLDGLYIQNDKYGDTLSCCFFRKGKRDGICKQFYSGGGALQSIEVYDNGKPEGEWKYWYESGVVKETKYFSQGKENGLRTEYYSNGQMQSAIPFVNDVIEGKALYYYSSGTLRLEMEYKEGIEWNLIQHNKPNGKKQKKAGMLVNGTGSIRVFSAEGDIEYERNLVDGKYEGTQKKYDKGKLGEETICRAGLKNGTRKTYYNGKILSVENYVNDTLDGHVVYYHLTGKKSREGDYNKGKKVPGTWKRYTLTGYVMETFDKQGNKQEPVCDGLVFSDGKKDTSLSSGNRSVGGNFHTTQQVFQFAEQQATFIDGEQGFFSYLQTTIKYPILEKEQNHQGTVYVNFIINRLGFIECVSVLKSAYPGLDAEAVRVIKAMPRWTPGYMGGMPVRLSVTQPIKFILQ